MNSYEFEIKDKFNLSFGPAVLVKCSKDTKFGTLSSVNGFNIINIQIPRKVDKTGNQIEGHWVFHLDKSANLNDFQIGETVIAK